MDEIRQKVSRAQRRLSLSRFLHTLFWSLFAALWVALAAIAVPKIWVLQVDPNWLWYWAGGCAAAGLVAAAIIFYVRRPAPLSAAIEIDRRFGLKERVASTLSLRQEDFDSEAGKALIADTARRVERIDVREHFQIRPTWHALLPIVPALAVFLLATFVSDRAAKEAEASNSAAAAQQRQIKKATQQLAKELRRKKKELAEKGLKDMDATLKKMEKVLEDVNQKKKINRQQAMVKINDVAKELAKKRDQLGGADDMKREMQKLKDLQKGPGKKLGNALKDGDLKQAMQELKKLQDEIRSGKMSKEQQKKLADQLQQVKNKMDQYQQAREQAKQDLKQQIAEKKAKGDLEGAGKLQRKLDKLNAQNQQMQQMQKMANQLQKAADSLQKGDSQQAADQMQQLADSLSKMQSELDQLETIDEMMDQIEQAKMAMQGQGQDGQDGDGNMPGMGNGNGFGDGKGNGLGQGRGEGDRPESETEKSFYSSKVAQKARKGEAVREGYADGPNRAGYSRATAQQEVESAYSEKSDPLNNQPLPKFQREHTKEYFDRLREGE